MRRSLQFRKKLRRLEVSEKESFCRLKFRGDLEIQQRSERATTGEYGGWLKSSHSASLIFTLPLLRCGTERYLDAKLRDLTQATAYFSSSLLFFSPRGFFSENMEQRFFEIWSTFLIIRQIKRRISENNDKIHDESTLPIFPFFFFFLFFFFFMYVYVQDDIARYEGVGSERKSSKQFCQALKYKRAGPLLSRMMTLNIHFARRPLCITSRLLLCLRNFYP